MQGQSPDTLVGGAHKPMVLRKNWGAGTVTGHLGGRANEAAGATTGGILICRKQLNQIVTKKLLYLGTTHKQF